MQTLNSSVFGASFRRAGAALSLLAAASLLASPVLASSPAAGPESVNRFSKLPTPTTVVPFTAVPHRFEGATIRVALTIDAEGHATGVTDVDRLPLDLRGRILPTVAQWQFSPALDHEGRPVPIRVIVPLHLVADSQVTH